MWLFVTDRNAPVDQRIMRRSFKAACKREVLRDQGAPGRGFWNHNLEPRDQHCRAAHGVHRGAYWFS